MSNKNLISYRFANALNSYRSNAIVQRNTAEEIINLIDHERIFENIFEIGAGSGILTDMVEEKLKYKKNTILDIVEECSKYHSNRKNSIFVCSDIEKFDFKEKYDLIISNATLQWVDDFEKVISNCAKSLTSNGVMVASIFGDKNLQEIKEVCGVGLEYLSIENIREILEKYFQIVDFKSQEQTLYFDSPIEVFWHLKKTGVTAINQSNRMWTKSKWKDILNQYQKRFSSENNRCKLTYHPIIFSVKRIK